MRSWWLGVVFGFSCAALAAGESPVGISYVETKDLKLYYYDSLSYLVPHAVRTFTNSLAWQRRMLGWTPSQATVVLLQDIADYGNANAYAAPRSTLVFEVEPLSHAFETQPATERMYSLMNHELIHVVQGDLANDRDRFWRRFFLGKVAAQPSDPETLLYSYLTVPRFTTPRWYSEGTAVFFETWMGGGVGRAQGGYDEMVFRSMVRDGAHFYDPLGLVSRGTFIDFQVLANAYLYGTRFVTWLAYTYSPEKVLAWVRRDEDSKRYYDDRFQQVFGLPLEKAWQDWIAFEHEFQQRNLAEVRKFPITPQQNLSGRPLGSMSRVYYDEASGTLYGGFRYPGTIEHIGALNTRDGSIRRIVDIRRGLIYRVTSFAYDPSTKTAFYTNDNRGYQSYRDLMAVNVETGESRMLFENARIGEIALSPVDRTLFGVRHSNGLATLVRLPPPYDTWYEIYTFPYGVVPSDLDVSPDGRLLSASVEDVGGVQYVRVWPIARLLNRDPTPLSQFRFGESIPESFVFSRDGRYLYGSSYYTGVSNIFRYEVATGDVVAVSNAETGFFRPSPLSDGRLVVLSYTGDGFVPAIIDPKPLNDVSAIRFLGAEVVAKYPQIRDWQVPPPSTVDDEKLIVARGAYVPYKSIEPINGYPVLQGYKNTAALGYRLNFADPLQFTSLSVIAAYTPGTQLPANERGHFEIAGRYEFWRAALSWNRSDFYDLFGPVKRSRKGYAATVGHDWSLIFDEPRRLDLSVDVAYYDKIDTLPNAQNVQTSFTRLATAEAALTYTNVARSLGGVDDEKGLTWSAVLKTNRVLGDYVSQLHGTLDVGWPLPVPNASLWLRTAAGVSSGDRTNPVASFYFGSFGNNYVDNRDPKRYRHYDSLPGFEIDEVSAQSFVRELAEVNLPPVVLESAGIPSLYLNWLRPSVFAAALVAEPNSSPNRKTYGSIGTQMDMRISVLHWYDMMLSVGYALGVRPGGRHGSEWMISLKIL